MLSRGLRGTGVLPFPDDNCLKIYPRISQFSLTNTSIHHPHLALRGELTGVRSCEGVREDPWRGLSRGLQKLVWLEAAKAPISREAALAGRCLSIGT